MKAREYAVGDAVVHIRGSPRGIVIAKVDKNGLLRVKWESHVEERLPPHEVRLLQTSA